MKLLKLGHKVVHHCNFMIRVRNARFLTISRANALILGQEPFGAGYQFVRLDMVIIFSESIVYS
jgi:hypothetical protein